MTDSSQSARVHAQSLQLRPTLCSPMYCSPPDSSVQGILQARILELGVCALLHWVFWTQALDPGTEPAAPAVPATPALQADS